MGELEKQVLMSVIDLMKSGGEYATIGVVVYFVYKLIYVSIIGGFLCLIINRVGCSAVAIYKQRLEHKLTKVSLVSEQCNQSINSVINSLQDSLTQFQSFVEQQQKFIAQKKESKESLKKK